MKKLLLLIFLFAGLHIQSIYAQCAASFSFSPNNASPPVFVNFTSTSTGSGPLTYVWNFGDGSIDLTPNPSHVYQTPGMYTVCLNISDGMGCTDSFCTVLTVAQAPIIQYFDVDSASSYTCIAPASVGFFYYAYAGGYPPTDSIKFEVNFGDGVDSIYYQSCANTNFQGAFNHIYQNPGTYTTQLIMTGPDLQADTFLSQNIIVGSTCGSVSGTVYQDLNNNCINDAGDLPMENIPLQIFSGSQFIQWTSTDLNGNYSFNVPTGTTYDIHIIASGGYQSHFVPTCPSSGIISVSSVPSTGNDFGVNCPPGFDLQGWVSGWGFRPGFTASVCVYAYNQFCNTPSGQIELVLSSNLIPLPDTSGIGYTISGNTVTLPINSPDLYWSFCFPVTVSAGAQIGDSACITMNLTPVAGDSIPANNSMNFCFPIRNSWDPNDKYATPAGEGPQGAIRPNTELTYTVRFQNTGNAEAINIYILDTLDSDLDETSVEIIASSHDMHWSLLTGNILRFDFDNILLPDSNANEPASHGYVSYRIRHKNNLTNLTAINNSASIYFDFNPPIYTNVTLNTIDQFLGISPVNAHSSLSNVFPNPSNDKCILSFRDNTEKTVVVTDKSGKEVYRKNVAGLSFTLLTDKLPAGLYTVRILNEKNSPDAVKLMVIH